MRTAISITLMLIWLTMACQSKKQPEQHTSVAKAQTAEKVQDQDVELSNEKAYYPELQTYIENLDSVMGAITDERKQQLKKLALYIKTRNSTEKPTRLMFICTHNSRRSHMSEIWATVASDYFNIANIETSSGGTESTAFNPRAIAALQRAGFDIEPTDDRKENPVYKVAYSNQKPELRAFSKKYTHEQNPQSDFCAVMTCSDADKNCPTVGGASFRVAIPYEDPKVADGTDMEQAKYDERCKQIAAEQFYLFSQVNTL